MKLSTRWYDADSRRRLKRAKIPVVATIDRGHPALLCSEETGLVVGYLVQGDDKRLLVRQPYSNKGEEPTLLDKRPWGFSVITGLPQRPRRTEYVDSLRRAVELAHAPHGGGDRDYACGFAAYENWISDLVDETKVNRIAKQSNEAELSNANAHIYYCLIDARQCAAKYLRRLETELGSAARSHLARAAELYDDIAKRLGSGRDNIVWSWQHEQGEAWTSEMRARQAALLKEAATIERQAIAQLERVVTEEEGT